MGYNLAPPPALSKQRMRRQKYIDTMIDWNSTENTILFNPRMPAPERERLLAGLSCLEDKLYRHVFFATSGSNGKLKWVALAKSAILCSAQAVNKHVHSNSEDIWLNPLPEFHVGGVGILARAHLSGAGVTTCHFSNAKWHPQQFIQMVEQNGATLTSLVPAQVFDLVSLHMPAPSALRAVIVGGGALSEQVYFSAIRLGWKLLPSYGLTECASQVATAEYGSWELPEFPSLLPLDHIKLSVDENGFLKIKSDALLTAYFEVNEHEVFSLRDPKNEGWFTSEDVIEFDGNAIKRISRGTHFIKIGGESVDLLRLEKILEEERLALQFHGDIALTALEDERLGFRIFLAIAVPMSEGITALVERYQQRVFPFERISSILSVREIPRSSLHKLLPADLKRLLSCFRDQV